MPDHRSAALETVLAYHHAWTAHEFDRAMDYVADDIVCDAPAGQLTGAEAFRAFMEPFSRIVTRSAILGAFGDETSAVLVYDTTTRPVADAPGAEHLTVENGRITRMRIIFDRLPFDQARRDGLHA